MGDLPGRHILTVNTGSSSLKATLYDFGDDERLILSAEVRRIGIPDSQVKIADSDGNILADEIVTLRDHSAALEALCGWLEERGFNKELAAVGHRVVHGGPRYREPQLMSAEMLVALRELIPFDPDHLPQAINAIEFISSAHPDLRQVACFDTAFHRHIPKVAQKYALPQQFYDEGILRYGFHGLSYEYIAQELERLDGALAREKVIVAHLGNGASMAAIRGSKSVDTTMGFTPVEGLVMGTRCGDIDAGALIYFLKEKKMTPEAINTLINKESGLLGISSVSEDVRDLLERESSDPRAAEALQLFCYRAKKYLGAYTAVLGGLDILVFTGGIGENAAPVRERICSGLEFLGIKIDAARNRENAPIVSSDDSRVKVRVAKTNENLMIARHTAKLIRMATGSADCG